MRFMRWSYLDYCWTPEMYLQGALDWMAELAEEGKLEL
jgi:hypothetical protein